mmetsp:Transcript_31957/g.42181  ORF Transcript_31957/g.42181 Transcript_31957/m.42181 type:complete len:123 (-) Transcript_31957:99-467(-)|eukprot:CAMPEP_0117760600 /NCGR_PEP_ID=MMETSP0947-20121206/16729_1 /TAXON_ID=44440 /ORGANISM="Chattonella subsalsa, Strain CCMP2191" /LENGTH=122 /DNA_ID=CAMNT_0005581327 /DNA_START=109 /DNA_END=477 /DNA_ORIENTATION=+
MLSSISKLTPLIKSHKITTLLSRTVSSGFVPLGDRVLIKRVETSNQTAGGIYLPDSSQKKPNEGNVLAVGPGARDVNGNLIPPTVAVGDKVLLPEYGGQTVEIDGEELHILRNDDIIGKFAS